ncbi:MAG: cell envelope integrity protein CreD [Nevskia sp.]
MSRAPLSERFGTPVARLLLIGLLLAILMIPATMIRGVVAEREARRSEAVADIVGKWGGRQDLQGPILRLPYLRRTLANDEHGRPVERRETGVAYLLPKTLNVDAELKSERRQRGLFEVPVYVARLKLQGHFDRPDFGDWGLLAEDVDWPHAELLVGISDPRSLQGNAALLWNARTLTLQPSTGQAGSWPAPGIHAALASPFAAEGADFELTLAVNGAQSLYFAPTAETTRVRLRSDWPHPSFQGAWLPAQREVGAQGFTAQWSVSYLGRDYPQRWRESAAIAATVRQTGFGVVLATPVDLYSRADRVTKYALLTLVFTFAVVWLTEVLSARRVHPVQYAFIGAALCLFGLLQLSFAEHFGFTAAFVAAASAVIGLVTLYGYSVLGTLRRAAALGGVLGGLYAYLFTILQAEDYALLGGSLALFAGIAAAMWLTRRIDWFATAPRDAAAGLS